MTSLDKADLPGYFGYFGTLAHGPVLKNKYCETKDPQLYLVLNAYEEFVAAALNIPVITNDTESVKKAIEQLTDILNRYRSFAIPVLEKRDNSGQENLRSSILEEFFQILLFPLTGQIREKHADALKLGKANSYVGLTFAPRSFSSLFENPTPYIHTKDQDFVLGCAVEVISRARCTDPTAVVTTLSEVVIPVIAIESKTYIERNMLDSCAGTARRIKAAMPYCLYIVAAEYMKMDEAYPELTDINEVFILTKKSNSHRLKSRNSGAEPHVICSDLIQDIYNMAASHLNKIWWSPEDALSRGRVIGRP
ncbi:Bpu10I restriction endonuclease [Nitrosospira sp. Nsp18]|uniref:Bpu10I family restriction endonuclease n=1 Tax=Nitrosospira sp. Nsp18 TaxID=1855334 RepID=UPI000880083F|nr:Bpu10I family restriction endonuclease [Nitrosospira sp. Nsp18]SDA14869.1 Bpu10I restriction endonuclease [Nitrosospira sp. Nsp18]